MGLMDFWKQYRIWFLLSLVLVLGSVTLLFMISTPSGDQFHYLKFN